MNLTTLNKKGITMTQLKLIGIIFMIFDHIHEFFNFAPTWFNCIGRLVAPMFLFSLAEGMYYTSNRKKYLSRLYIASILMAIGNTLVMKLFPSPTDSSMIIINNIFATLFLTGLYIVFVDKFKLGIKNKSFKIIVQSILLMLLPLLLSALSLMIMSNENIPLIVFQIIMIFIPNPMLVEGGIIFIIIGVMLYIFRNNRTKEVLIFIIISLASLFMGSGFNFHVTFVENYQWMMIFASIFMLLYSNKKGTGYKKFFYIFYPSHIYILYILSILLTK